MSYALDCVRRETPTGAMIRLRPPSLHLQLLARIERVVERGVDHIEHAPCIARANGETLFEAIDR